MSSRDVDDLGSPPSSYTEQRPESPSTPDRRSVSRSAPPSVATTGTGDLPPPPPEYQGPTAPLLEGTGIYEDLPPLLTPAHGVPIPAGSLSDTPTADNRDVPRLPPAPVPGAEGIPPPQRPAFRTPSPFSLRDPRNASPGLGVPSLGVPSPASYSPVLTPAHGVPAATPASPASPVSPFSQPYGVPSPSLGTPVHTYGVPGPAVRTDSLSGVSVGLPAGTPSHGVPQSSGRSPTFAPRPAASHPVGGFCQAFVRAAFGARRYLASDASQVEYVRQAHASLTALLQQQTPLVLELRGRTIVWSGEAMFQDDDIEGGLVTSLSAQGVEQLSFKRGITQEDLRRILDVVASALSRRTSGDVTTRLWCLGNPHFSYVAVDPFDPVGATRRPLHPEHEQYRQLVVYVSDVAAVAEPPAEALASWASPPPLPWAEALGGELSDRHEELVEQDALPALMARASLLLLGALGAEAEPTAETPAWRLMSDLLRAVVCNGRFEEAVALLDRMQNYAQRATSSNVSRMADGVHHWLGGEEMVSAVLNIFEQLTEEADIRAGVLYLQRLGAPADVSLWRLAGKLRSDIARFHVADVLVQATERDPQAALEHLNRQVPALVIDLVAQAEPRRTRGADLLWWYGLEHPDVDVRATATKLLRRRDGPVVEDVLLVQLEDSEAPVRLAALDAIGCRPRQALLNHVQGYFKPERIGGVTEGELTLAMLAFARILRNRAVPQLSHLLNEAPRLRLGAKAVEVQIKAAQLLGAIPDQAAVKTLQFAARTRHQKLREVCQRAIEGYYAQALNTETLPKRDLTPRSPMLPAPDSSGRRRSSPAARRVARGIVGLPTSDPQAPSPDRGGNDDG